LKTRDKLDHVHCAGGESRFKVEGSSLQEAKDSKEGARKARTVARTKKNNLKKRRETAKKFLVAGKGNYPTPEERPATYVHLCDHNRGGGKGKKEPESEPQDK